MYLSFRVLKQLVSSDNMSIVFTAISTSVAEAAASVKDPKRSCTFLPTYPSFVNSTNEFTLLLANIPGKQMIALDFVFLLIAVQ